MKYFQKQLAQQVVEQRLRLWVDVSTFHMETDTNSIDQMQSRFPRMQRLLCAQNYRRDKLTQMTKTFVQTDSTPSNDLNVAPRYSFELQTSMD